MINLGVYKNLISAISDTADQRNDLEQFISLGGRYKLEIKCTENPEIAALMTDIFRTTNGFDQMMQKAVAYLNSKETRYRESFLAEASSEALAHEIQRAAE